VHFKTVKGAVALSEGILNPVRLRQLRFMCIEFMRISSFTSGLGTAAVFLGFDIQGFSWPSSGLGTAEGYLRFDIQGFSWPSSGLGTAEAFLRFDIT